MRTLSSTEVKQSFGAALDAAQREPVFIQKQNRDVAVLMSVQEYEKLRGLRFEAFDRTVKKIAGKAAKRGLTPAKFKELMADES